MSFDSFKINKGSILKKFLRGLANHFYRKKHRFFAYFTENASTSIEIVIGRAEIITSNKNLQLRLKMKKFVVK